MTRPSARMVGCSRSPSRAFCRCVLASSLPHSSAVLTPAGSVRSHRCSANGMAPPLPRTAAHGRLGATPAGMRRDRALSQGWSRRAACARLAAMYAVSPCVCVCPTGRSCVFAKNRHAWPHRGERRCFAFVSREGTPHTRACAQAVRAGPEISRPKSQERKKFAEKAKIQKKGFWPVLAVFKPKMQKVSAGGLRPASGPAPPARPARRAKFASLSMSP